MVRMVVLIPVFLQVVWRQTVPQRMKLTNGKTLHVLLIALHKYPCQCHVHTNSMSGGTADSSTSVACSLKRQSFFDNGRYCGISKLVIPSWERQNGRVSLRFTACTTCCHALSRWSLVNCFDFAIS